MSRLLRAALAGVAALAVATTTAVPATAGTFDEPGSTPPQSTSSPQTDTAGPGGSPTCRIYASSAGFGLLCSTAAGGMTLAQLLEGAGIDYRNKFCWDDADLPDGWEPDRVQSGPGAWWLDTCLEFVADTPSRANARLTYEYHFHAPGEEKLLTEEQEAVIRLVTGRGQIPFLQLQTTPVSSPRVDQPVAFSMLCDDKVQCSNSESGGRQVRTPYVEVGGVRMHAELVHLEVLPRGVAVADRIGCQGAGLPRTAEQLDAGPEDDPFVCRFTYRRSSNEVGGGTDGDRYAVHVTAYWQVYVDEGLGPRPFGLPYEKITTQSLRVTEVQTLVVS